jgi:hypothetical protein
VKGKERDNQVRDEGIRQAAKTGMKENRQETKTGMKENRQEAKTALRAEAQAAKTVCQQRDRKQRQR